ncbi:MAG: hypothetical protein JNK32_08310 [Anaerolineales bacterium]|nr:hypothetical protein [Anaerolineales bacterium]
MSRFFKSILLHILLTLLFGIGLGLAYSWFISPVTYVDANPALLRADFKDQFRIVIAASYASNQDLARARARLSLLGDADPIGELSAQAQRMLASGEAFENAQPLAELATDLRQGRVSEPFTPTAFPTFNTPDVPLTVTPTAAEPLLEATEEFVVTSLPTILFEQTPLTPITTAVRTPRSTFTPTAGPGAPFALMSQETLCNPGTPSLLQFMLMDSRKRQAPGIEIIVTWDQGEDRFFTGLKPELGDGYADFIMQANTTYNIRIVTGGTLAPNIIAPSCTDPNGQAYPGSLLLTFQQ